MDRVEIRSKIKEIIGAVASINPSEMGDSAHFVDELNLDSLSLLEIGVDVDYEFKLGMEDLEERLKTLENVEQTVQLVETLLGERAAHAAVA